MKKNIKSVTVYRKELVVNHLDEDGFEWKNSKYSHTEFDPGGNAILEMKFFKSGEVEEKYEYAYDENGRIIEEKEYLDESNVAEHRTIERNGEGKATRDTLRYQDGSEEITEYIYNQEGRLTGKITRNEDGEIEKQENYEYVNGLLAKKTESEYGEPVSDETYRYHDNGKVKERIRHNEGEEAVFVNTFDPEGRIMEAKRYDTGNKLLGRTSYTYDESGKPARITEESKGGISVTEIGYDHIGNAVTETEKDREGNVIHSAERSYNDNNDVVESIVFVNHRGRAVNQHYILKYEYEYF
ncbi:MAG: hypothetical protein JXA03_14325 [Bacteroidales bacterium]|nr:hypothetical protein [Bacteroidales bacterium]